MLTRSPGKLVRGAQNLVSRGPSRRVLMDLSHAADGYVGIAQDLRLVFGMLSQLPDIGLTGLLMPTARHDLPRLSESRPDGAAMTAGVLHWMERSWSKPPPKPFPANIATGLRTWRQVLRVNHGLVPLADRSQMNALWRILFAKTLPPSWRETVLAQEFVATDLSVSSVIDHVMQMPGALAKRLDTRGYDAVLFGMPRPVRLPRGVRPVMRFFDAVPLTDSDTVAAWRQALAHARLIRACTPDTLFVCISPQSRETLLGLDPSREKTSVVIPCALAPPSPVVSGIDPAATVTRYRSFRALGLAEPPPGWSAPESGFRYVLSVSTLEPRKNFPGLIRAFERVAARSDPNLRLVIVGGPGWRESTVFEAMRPGVASGAILHLQNLPPDDLHALMAHSACFAFPSFNEGFGYSPVEAMQAGAAALVSDLPVFRWIFGDAVLYADPYDVESIACGIERLAVSSTRGELAATLRSRAESVLARFRPERVRDSWESLFFEYVEGAG